GFHAPADSFGVAAAFRAFRGGEPRDFKPGMMLQHLNEALADDTGGAKNPDANLSFHRGVIRILQHAERLSGAGDAPELTKVPNAPNEFINALPGFCR